MFIHITITVRRSGVSPGELILDRMTPRGGTPATRTYTGAGMLNHARVLTSHTVQAEVGSVHAELAQVRYGCSSGVADGINTALFDIATCPPALRCSAIQYAQVESTHHATAQPCRRWSARTPRLPKENILARHCAIRWSARRAKALDRRCEGKGGWRVPDGFRTHSLLSHSQALCH